MDVGFRFIIKERMTWDGWRDNIKNLYNNGTEQHLDALFNYWYNY